MEDDTKPTDQVFRHRQSIFETTPKLVPISNITLKRRLEGERELTVPLKRLDNTSLKRFEANPQKSQASSIYTMDCDKFIDEIMIRPGIWDTNDANYKNKVKVKTLWKELHQNFPSMPVGELKKRWKNLKDGYRKELKRLQIKRAEGDFGAKPTWRFFDRLQFLKDSVKWLPSDYNDISASLNETDTNEVETSSQSPVVLGMSKSEEEEEENGYVSNENDSDIKTELLRMERKKMCILEEEIAKRNQYINSDNYHFLMSLLPEMDKLAPVQKMRLRTKISQAILEEVSLNVSEQEQVDEEVEPQPSPSVQVSDEENTIEQDIKDEYNILL